MSLMAPRAWALREALRRFARQPVAAIGAWLLMSTAIALPLAIASAVWSMKGAWTQLDAPAQVLLFAAPGTSAADITTLVGQARAQPGVTDARHVPRDAALDDLTRRAVPGSLPELRSNPLPDTVVVTLAHGIAADAATAAVEALRKLGKVDAVHFDPAAYQRWSGLRRIVAALGGVTGLALALIALGAVIWGPRPFGVIGADELRVLRLAGADGRFIRRPGAYAGALLGAVAGATAIAAVAAGIAALMPHIAGLGLTAPVRLSLPPWPVVVTMLAAAALLGGISGSDAGRTTLRSVPL